MPAVTCIYVLSQADGCKAVPHTRSQMRGADVFHVAACMMNSLRLCNSSFKPLQRRETSLRAAAQDHGKTSATASLGLITLWDVEGGLPQIDKYLYSQDPAVVAGALLGVGIINSSVQACCVVVLHACLPEVTVPTGWQFMLPQRPASRLGLLTGLDGAFTP